VYDAYTSEDPQIIKSLLVRAPLHEAILGLVVELHPQPNVAQK
jgi:elongation factor 2